MITKLIKIIANIFIKKPDPLDEMLLAKGIDPVKLMEDIQDKRIEEGNSNAINRVFDRWEKEKKLGDKYRTKIRNPGNIKW